VQRVGVERIVKQAQARHESPWKKSRSASALPSRSPSWSAYGVFAAGSHLAEPLFILR
jgi:hypothetical protein